MSSNALIPVNQFSLSTSTASLDAYINWSYQIPLLTEEEEKTLAKKLHEQNDIESARQLILAHLRYVIKIAKGYSGYGLPLADLIQEGNIGLMKAVKRFDPSFGVRLVTFAVYWIKSEIHDFIIKNWRIVKIATTKSQRKLFFNLRSYKKKIGTWFTKDEIKQVADDLNVPKEEVLRMEQRLHAIDSAFDLSPDENEDKNHLAPINYLEDHSANPAFIAEQNDSTSKDNLDLNHALNSLDQRSQDIIRSRWLTESKSTLHDLASKYNISAERVRQLEKSAMNLIKKNLSRGAIA